MKPQRPRGYPLGTQKEFPLSDIAEKIIACASEVHSTLGPGLLESVYEEAMAHEFTLRGIKHEKQKEIILGNKENDIVRTLRVDMLFRRISSSYKEVLCALRGLILTLPAGTRGGLNDDGPFLQ
jgi:hypothetical protein